MRDMKTTLIINRLAYQLGNRYYPFSLKKSVHEDGNIIYTLEMNIGHNDIIISDAATLEEVFQKHLELINCAFATRSLQKKVLS
jgi:urease accessory protein UreE